MNFFMLQIDGYWSEIPVICSIQIMVRTINQVDYINEKDENYFIPENRKGLPFFRRGLACFRLLHPRSAIVSSCSQSPFFTAHL